MIYVTGDIHGDVSRFSKKKFPEQKELTKDDIVIVLGDFGVIWWGDEDKEEKYNLDILENKPFTVAFIDGNHENFDRLGSFPSVEWHGGYAHQIRSNIYHLMRAQVYTIEDKTFFTFGGAASHDINGCATKEELKADYSAGVLRRDDPRFDEKKRMCHRDDLFYRIEGESWWRAEMPSESEMEAGREKLESVGWKVDYVLTHECPSSILELYAHGRIDKDKLTDYLEEIKQKLTYKEWYFGHHHDSVAVTDKDIMLYFSIQRVL